MTSAGGIRAGKAFVELYGDDSKLTRMLKGSKAKLTAWGQSIGALGTQIAAAGAAMLAPLAIGLKTFMSAGDELDKMSSRVGASVEFLSALGHAANIGGTNIAGMEVGIRRMQRTAMDATRGLSTAVDTFDELGISATDAGGNLKGTEQLFMESAAALSKLENNTKKAALAQMLFGRAGTTLLPMLKDGADGLEAVMLKAKELGIVMSTDDATAAAEMVDRWTELKAVLKMSTIQIGSALAPAIKSVTEYLTETLSPMIDWIKQNSDAIIVVGKLAVGTIALGAALKGLGLATTLLAANPIVLVLGTAAAAAIYFSGALDDLTAKTYLHSQASDDSVKAGDARRKSMLSQLSELEALSQKEQLNNQEMERAESIIATLTDQYGNLGIKLDEAGRKVLDFSKGQEAANKAMREAAELDIRNQIRDLQRQQQDLIAGMGQATAGEKFEMFSGMAVVEAMAKGKGPDEMPAMERMEKRWKGLGEEADALNPKLELLWARLRALQTGDTSALIGGESGGAAGISGAAQAMDDLLYRQRQIRRGMIEDQYQRELALINLKYKKELDAAEGAEAKIAEIRKTRLLELEALDAKHAKKKEQEAKSVADQEEQMRRDVERAEIEAGMKGAARDKALLQLERDYAIIEAKKISPELARLTGKLFDLKAIGGEGRERFTTVGTFSAIAAARMGGGGVAERNVAANEKAAVKLDKIQQLLAKAGPLVFV